MRWGVVVFPGSLDDRDTLRAARRVLGDEAVALWHKDRELGGVDCVVLPGGFSYGDYLRCGAMAKCSPIMEAVARHARDGGLVLGICNGFQILCEAGLLPGALVRNRSLSFVCDLVTVRVEATDTFLTQGYRAGEVLELPVKHGEGCYVADEICPDTCRLWDKGTGEKLDKDRFRRDLGGVEDAYQEAARRICSAAA